MNSFFSPKAMNSGKSEIWSATSLVSPANKLEYSMLRSAFLISSESDFVCHLIKSSHSRLHSTIDTSVATLVYLISCRISLEEQQHISACSVDFIQDQHGKLWLMRFKEYYIVDKNVHSATLSHQGSRSPNIKMSQLDLSGKKKYNKQYQGIKQLLESKESEQENLRTNLQRKSPKPSSSFQISLQASEEEEQEHPSSPNMDSCYIKKRCSESPCGKSSKQ